MIKTAITSVAVALLTVAASFAQDATAPKVKVDFKDVKFESQPTPQIQAQNIVDKRWKPKTWLEIDSDFDIKLPTSEGREASFPALTFNYFLVMNAMSKESPPKRIMLKGTVTYQNIPSHEKCHALAFVSPATMKAALQKDNGGKGDVVGYYVEIVAGGQTLAFKNQGGAGAKWWEDTAKFSVMDGGVLGKDKTPFAPFWGDYDVTPQSK